MSVQLSIAIVGEIIGVDKDDIRFNKEVQEIFHGSASVFHG